MGKERACCCWPYCCWGGAWYCCKAADKPQRRRMAEVDSTETRIGRGARLLAVLLLLLRRGLVLLQSSPINRADRRKRNAGSRVPGKGVR